MAQAQFGAVGERVPWIRGSPPKLAPALSGARAGSVSWRTRGSPVRKAPALLRGRGGGGIRLTMAPAPSGIPRAMAPALLGGRGGSELPPHRLRTALRARHAKARSPTSTEDYR